MTKKTSSIPMSRRDLLKIGGQGIAVLPPMFSLLPGTAWAQSPRRIQRIILAPCPYGINPDDFFPQTPALNLQTQRLTPDLPIFTTPLSSFPPNLSRALGPAFNSALLRSQTNIYQGLDVTNGSTIVSHTDGALAGVSISDGVNSGYQPLYGETIDNILARNSVFNPSTVPHRVIRIQTKGGNTNLSFTRNNGVIQYQPFMMGDRAPFERIFGNLQTQSPSAAAIRADDQKNILERTLAAYNQVKTNTRLSLKDRELLDHFVSNINSLSNSMTNNGPMCTVPNIALESGNNGQYWAFPGNFDGLTWGIQSCTKMIDNISEIIANAFICDQTRIVVWANEIWQDSPVSGYTMSGQFHSHDDGNGGPLSTADKHAYFFNRLASLAERLAGIQDPLSESGTLLDNSLILVTNEHSSVVGHHTFSIPTFTIGGFGGKIKTGLYFDCRQRPYTTSPYHTGIGRPGKQLLQAVMNAAGLARSDYINIGDGRGFGDFLMYPFGAADSKNHAAFAGTHNDPLPYL